MSQSHETQAIAKLKRGDINGLEYLVRQHQVEAVRAAYLITQDPEIAKDIVQTAFIRVYERIHQFDSTRSFAPWFFRMVANAAIKEMTKGQRFEPLDMANADIETTFEKRIDAVATNPERALETAEFEQIIADALATLPPDQRAAVVLYYYLDVSVGEMAKRLDTSAGTIKWRLHAARQHLKRILSGWNPGGQPQVQED